VDSQHKVSWILQRKLQIVFSTSCLCLAQNLVFDKYRCRESVQSLSKYMAQDPCTENYLLLLCAKQLTLYHKLYISINTTPSWHDQWTRNTKSAEFCKENDKYFSPPVPCVTYLLKTLSLTNTGVEKAFRVWASIWHRTRLVWLVIWSLRTACSNKDYCSPVLCRQPALHHRHRTAPPSLVAFYDSPGELWAAEKFCRHPCHPLSAEVRTFNSWA